VPGLFFIPAGNKQVKNSVKQPTVIIVLQNNFIPKITGDLLQVIHKLQTLSNLDRK